MSIQNLREQRKNAAIEARKLLDESENRKWTSDDQTKYDQMMADIERLDREIENHQKLLDVEADNHKRVIARADDLGISTDEAQAQLQKDNEILNAWMRGGVSALTQDQQQYVAQRAREIRNTMSTGTGSEGGFAVPNEFNSELLEALKSYGGMREVATVIQTTSGATMDMPTTDATSEEGEIVGENASASNEDADFGTKAISTFKYSSKSIAVPFELLQDSAIDLEAHIRQRLRQRLGRITNKHFTIGTDSGQPNGIVTASGAGKVGATGQTTSMTYDDLVDLEHSVDPAYREEGGCRYMFHDTTLRELKKLKDSQNRPLWVPGIAVSEPDTLNGYAYTVNQAMPVMAANAKSVLFGDMSHYVIRDVMQIMLFRMTDSKYTEKGQVGFLAFMRSGGNLVDVGGAVKHYANSAT
jgi:HK97 family phage major capsid protein